MDEKINKELTNNLNNFLKESEDYLKLYDDKLKHIFQNL